MRHEYDMGVIGNCNYLAYVNKQANVSWLCWPRFDSDFVFGGLLDEGKGGEFSIRPESDNFESDQNYVKNTNVLETTFKTESGIFKVTDFAPRYESFGRITKPLILIRKIQKISGAPKIKITCEPRGSYGAITPEVILCSNHIKYLGLEKVLRLNTNAPLNYIKDPTPFMITDDIYLLLEWDNPFHDDLKSRCEESLRLTKEYWKKWVRHASIPIGDQVPVIRSSLVLKLHQYEDTGGIIASGTTSLPESPESKRNWDYRFCWIRDSYYTLSALSQLGHFEETFKYLSYLQNIGLEDPVSCQPFYSITGESKLVEKELDLKGYLGNKPVRIGNEAYIQTQHDMHGQILLSLLPLYLDERYSDIRPSSTEILNKHLNLIEKYMEAPDAGIWEFRGKEQLHTHTLLFHWAGSAGVEKIAKKFKNEDLEHKAKILRQRAAELLEECYDEQQECYTTAKGNPNLDASSFLLVTMNYLDHNSEKAKKHVSNLAKGLSAGDGLIYRYRHTDDFGEPEVAFGICGFWYAEALACIGEIDKAKEVFHSHIEKSNHLGLMSEDLEPENFSQWGNFPQTYSHVGLILCYYRILTKLNQPNFL